MVVPIAQASAMTTAEFEAALMQLNQQLAALQAQIDNQNSSAATDPAATTDTTGQVAGAQTSTTATPATFLVTVDGSTAHSTNTSMTSAAATKLCESYAYSHKNYFKNVVCEHKGSVIYDYTFIPG